jgi:excisionase family DNA binding protein
MGSDYLTPDDIASQLQVSRQVVYNWINDGRLRAVKAGRTLRIPHYALEAFLQPVQVGEIRRGDIEADRGYHLDRFTTAVQAVFEEANNEVRKRQHIKLEVEHVLWALLQETDGITQQILQRFGIDGQQVTQQLGQILADLPNDSTYQHSPHALAVDVRVSAMLERAEKLASRIPDLQIDTSHLLQALDEEAGGVSAQILHSLGITPDRLRGALIDARATHHALALQAAVDSRQDWAQRVEQQLVRIETEVATLRSMLAQQTSTDTA